MAGTSETEPAYGRVYLSGVGGNGAHRGIIWAAGDRRAFVPSGKLWEDTATNPPEIAFERMKTAALKLKERPIELFIPRTKESLMVSAR